jgi:4-amino-4-deoxy-L-arabinose transferase-like glycosyltransferase
MHVAQLTPASLPSAGTVAGRLAAALRPHRALLAILAIGLVVRLALLAASTPLTLRIVDEQHYATLAANVLGGDGFAWGPGQPTSMRPPLYPFFVALVWRVWGSESLQAIRGVQILLSLLTVAGVYVLGLRLFNRHAGVAAACILCLYPSFLFAGVLLLTEVLFAFLLVMLALLYHGLLRRPTAATAAGVGVTLGLAALTRSVLWPFPVVLAPLLCLSVRTTMTRRLALGACFAVGYLCIVMPWAARNIRLQHTFTVVDTMGGMNLLMGNYEHTPEDRMWDAVALLDGEKSWSHGLSQRHPDAVSWTDGQKEKWAQREALAYMAAHPLTTLRRTVLKFADFWGLEREMVAWFESQRPPAWVVWPAVVATAVAYPAVALIAAIGLWSLRPNDGRSHLMIVAVALFMTAVHSVVFGHSRYHLPLVAFLALYAGATWVGWRAGELRFTRRRLAGACVMCATLVSIWGYEIFVRDADRLRTVLGAWV